jgi:ppGpp synthetase/RelA/SpoT-type nucleotidyltranferase
VSGEKKAQELIDELIADYSKDPDSLAARAPKPPLVATLTAANQSLLREYLGALGKDSKPRVEALIARIAEIAKGKASLVLDWSTVRVEGCEKIVNRLAREHKELGDLYDIVKARIIVEAFSDIAAMMLIVEDECREDLLHLDNFFVKHDEDSPYRAVHYVIKLDDLECFELRILTKSEYIFSEIYNDIVIEDLYDASDEIKESLTAMYWGLQQKQLQEYMATREDK